MKKKRKERKQSPYLYATDKSIRVLRGEEIPQPSRHIGKLSHTPRSEQWNPATEKTMVELLERGLLSQYHVERMERSGIDVRSHMLKLQLEQLNLDKQEDFQEFARIASRNPEAVTVMNKIESKRKAESTRKRNAEIRGRLRKIDLDTPEGLQQFAELNKEYPEALDILQKMEREE